MSAIKIMKAVLVCILMFLTSFFGSLTMQIIFIWLMLVSPKFYRHYIDMTMYAWTSSVVTFMEYIMGLNFRVFGDKIISKERAVIIMNHRTRLDWLFLYGVFFKYGWCLRDEKIVLKNELKWIPGAGWAMQAGSYIFLIRKLDQASKHLSNMIEYLCGFHCKSKILIFPEGTDLCERSLSVSNRFAEKMGLEKYETVLHPRLAGFNHLIQEMMYYSQIEGEKLDAIYDFTVGYPCKNFATTEKEFIIGNVSTEIHFHCKRIAINELFNNDPELLVIDKNSVSNEIFKEKREALLKEFISDSWKKKEKTLLKYYSSEEMRHKPEIVFDSKEVIFNDGFVSDMLDIIARFICCSIICSNVILNMVLLYYYTKFWITFLLGLGLIYIAIGLFFNGLDQFSLRMSLGPERYRC